MVTELGKVTEETQSTMLPGDLDATFFQLPA
jgi:hypothetical protein